MEDGFGPGDGSELGDRVCPSDADSGSYDASDAEESEDGSDDASDEGGERAPATSPCGRRRWTPEEDKRVFVHVAEHGPGGWEPLAEELGRTTRAVGERYFKLLKLYPERQPEFGRSQWSTEDDLLMKKHVNQQCRVSLAQGDP
jgi:hypothetical protein